MKQGPAIEQLPKNELRRLIRRDLDLDTGQQATMTKCIDRSFDVWIGLYDGVIGCVWGVVHPTLLSNRAYFWLYTNDKMVLEHQFVFIRGSQIVLEDLLTRYETIYGEVEAKYPRAKRWLQWMGAKFSKREYSNVVDFEIRRK